jgi:cyclase
MRLGGEATSLEARQFALACQKAGVGEIALNSIDNDGTMGGMDLMLIKEVSDILEIPLVAIGGVGSIEDIRDAKNAGASAVAAGSFFLFHGPHRAVLISYPSYDQLVDVVG